MSEWRKFKLGDTLKKITGGGTPSKANPDYWNGDIFWCSVKDMTDERFSISFTEDKITALGLTNSASNLIKAGTVITATRMGLGRAFINKVDMAINQDLKALYPNDTIDNKYLLWSIIHKRSEIDSLGTGATVKGITLETLKSIEILLPPLPIQRRIASILSAYDDLIENNLKRIKLLEESLQIIQNKLSTETDSNPSLIYPEIADFEKGFEPGSNSYVDEYSNGLIPFIRVGDLNSRESKLYINSELKGIKMSQSDDILISMDGSIGIVSVGINGAYSSGIRKVALKNRLLKGLIYAFLKSPTGQSQIMTFAKGSTILHASSCIPKLKVIIPNEIKYKNEFELANSCLEQIIKLISQNKILKESRDILLPRLMSEKINVE